MVKQYHKEDEKILIPQNAELISAMIELGNLGKNIKVTGETKIARQKNFKNIYKNHLSNII